VVEDVLSDVGGCEMDSVVVADGKSNGLARSRPSGPALGVSNAAEEEGGHNLIIVFGVCIKNA
jgi:hypothetical protein